LSHNFHKWHFSERRLTLICQKTWTVPINISSNVAIHWILVPYNFHRVFIITMAIDWKKKKHTIDKILNRIRNLGIHIWISWSYSYNQILNITRNWDIELVIKVCFNHLISSIISTKIQHCYISSSFISGALCTNLNEISYIEEYLHLCWVLWYSYITLIHES